MIILSVTLSEACNLNCTYCNVEKNSTKKINVDLFLKEYYILRENNKNEKIQIDFFGGEPLLQFNLIKEILINLKNEKNITYFMPTNGILLDDEKIQILNKYNVRISLSYDGLWQKYNRQQKNGEIKTFNNNKNYLKQIKNLEIHSMINYNNYNILENHLYILEEFGINPGLTLIRDNIWYLSDLNKMKKSITELFDYYINNTSSEMPNFIKHFFMHYLMFKVKKTKKTYCGAGNTYLSFSENKLIPCNRFKNNDEFIKKIPYFINSNECAKCEISDVCEKGCLFENIKNDGVIKELCDLYKHIYYEIQNMFIKLKDDNIFNELIKKEIKKEYGIN